MNRTLCLSPLLMHVLGTIYAFLGIPNTMYVLYTYIMFGIPRRHEIIRNMHEHKNLFKPIVRAHVVLKWRPGATVPALCTHYYSSVMKDTLNCC